MLTLAITAQPILVVRALGGRCSLDLWSETLLRGGSTSGLDTIVHFGTVGRH